jgi:hypothetical protein
MSQNYKISAEHILGSWTVYKVSGVDPGIKVEAEFFIVGLGNGEKYRFKAKGDTSKLAWNKSTVKLQEIYEQNQGVTYLLEGVVTFAGSDNMLKLGTTDAGKSDLTILVESPMQGGGPGGTGHAGRP